MKKTPYLHLWALCLCSLVLVIGCKDDSADAPKGHHFFQALSKADTNARAYTIRAGGRCGVLDSNGKELLPMELGNCGDMSQGLVPVERGYKLGYLNGKGDWHLTPSLPFAANSFGADFNPDKNRSLILRQLAMREFHDGLAPIETQEGKWTFVRLDGGMAMEQSFDSTYGFASGYAPVRQGKNWSLIDAQGQVILPGPYEDMGLPAEGLVTVREAGQWKVVDLSTRQPLAGGFAWLSSYSEGLAVAESSGTFFYVNRQGRRAFAGSYSAAYSFSDGRALVLRGDAYAFVDSLGRQVGSEWSDAFPYSEGLALVFAKGKWGVVDTNGQWVVRPRWDQGGLFRGGRLVTSAAGKIHFVNKQGQVLWRQK